MSYFHFWAHPNILALYTFPSLQITKACFLGGGYSQLTPYPEYPPDTGGNDNNNNMNKKENNNLNQNNNNKKYKNNKNNKTTRAGCDTIEINLVLNVIDNDLISTNLPFDGWGVVSFISFSPIQNNICMQSHYKV